MSSRVFETSGCGSGRFCALLLWMAELSNALQGSALAAAARLVRTDNFIGSMRWNNFGAGRKLDICHFQQGMWFLVWECGWRHNEQEIQNWAGNHLTGDNLQSSPPLMNRNAISTTTSSVPPNPYLPNTGRRNGWTFSSQVYYFLITTF